MKTPREWFTDKLKSLLPHSVMDEVEDSITSRMRRLPPLEGISPPKGYGVPRSRVLNIRKQATR